VVRNTVSILHTFSSGSGLTLNWEKSGAYFWAAGSSQRPDWTNQFQFQWVSEHNLSKLLGTPFGISLSSQDVNDFLLTRTDKKLQYWTTKKLNSTGRAVICNGILRASPPRSRQRPRHLQCGAVIVSNVPSDPVPAPTAALSPDASCKKSSLVMQKK
jgi:hypothetical protein